MRLFRIQLVGVELNPGPRTSDSNAIVLQERKDSERSIKRKPTPILIIDDDEEPSVSSTGSGEKPQHKAEKKSKKNYWNEYSAEKKRSYQEERKRKRVERKAKEAEAKELRKLARRQIRQERKHRISLLCKDATDFQKLVAANGLQKVRDVFNAYTRPDGGNTRVAKPIKRKVWDNSVFPRLWKLRLPHPLGGNEVEDHEHVDEIRSSTYKAYKRFVNRNGCLLVKTEKASRYPVLRRHRDFYNDDPVCGGSRFCLHQYRHYAAFSEAEILAGVSTDGKDIVISKAKRTEASHRCHRKYCIEHAEYRTKKQNNMSNCCPAFVIYNETLFRHCVCGSDCIDVNLAYFNQDFSREFARA